MAEEGRAGSTSRGSPRRVARAPSSCASNCASSPVATAAIATTRTFWLHRVGEVLLETLRARVEASIPDLLPSARPIDGCRTRMRRILVQLKHAAPAAGAARFALRVAREFSRGDDPDFDALRTAAAELSASPLALALIDAELARANDDDPAALQALARAEAALEHASTEPCAARGPRARRPGQGAGSRTARARRRGLRSPRVPA